MKKILKKLDGKKTQIVSVIALTISFLALKSVIDNDTATYIQAVVSTIAYGAQVATNKMNNKK